MRVIAVGRMKESYLLAAQQEYLRRLKRYCKIEVLEVEDEKDPGIQAPALVQRAMDSEGQRILARLKEQDVVISLCITGSSMDSPAFAELISQHHDTGDRLVFVIGGSNGLSQSVLKRSQMQLSFSALTFPHQLARVLLLEQIYRAHKIRAGEKYHK